MTEIENASQLSTFDLIKQAILANTILSHKFNNSNIYQYEPKHKSSSFKGFPYILINIPELTPNKINFDNSVVNKELSISLFLRADYHARDNLLPYINNVIKAVEDYEDHFERAGYYDVMIHCEGIDSNQIVDEKEIVEATYTITLHGYTER